MTRHKSSGKLLATRSARLIVACALMVAAGNLSRRVSADNGVNPNALAIKEFTDRVKDYISLHKKMESALPPLKPSKDPADIDEHRKALAAGIRKARQTAKPGDIFGSAADLIRGVIKEDAEDRSVRASQTRRTASTISCRRRRVSSAKAI